MITANSFRSILMDHPRRYPGWEIQDLYKLIHQASLGSEHAALNEADARLWLERELANLGPGPVEPLVDPISADGLIVRVHLRTFVARGYQSADLLEAFIRTAREVHGSTDQFRLYWREASQMAGEGNLSFTSQAVDDYAARMAQLGFPAAHHSPAFTAEYRPAYRVVAKSFLPEGFTGMG